jgi:hypothetical protein
MDKFKTIHHIRRHGKIYHSAINLIILFPYKHFQLATNMDLRNKKYLLQVAHENWF